MAFSALCFIAFSRSLNKGSTSRRVSEEVTFNDVLRELLGLEPSKGQKSFEISKESPPWIVKGVIFPHGTEFRSVYKGQLYSGKVENGALVVNGKRFSAPSAAAHEITNNSVNGWVFWECKKPGDSSWRLMSKAR